MCDGSCGLLPVARILRTGGGTMNQAIRRASCLAVFVTMLSIIGAVSRTMSLIWCRVIVLVTYTFWSIKVILTTRTFNIYVSVLILHYFMRM